MITTPSATLLVAVTIILIFLLSYWRSRSNPKCLPYPPGPKPHPLFGNIFGMPKEYPWITYAGWSKICGDVIHLEALGKHFVVLNSAEAVNDLLEQRSAIYSDRPRMPMMVELVGWVWNFGMIRYSPDWRRRRKIFHHYFRSENIHQYRPISLLEARKMLVRLSERPEDFKRHIQCTAAGIISKIVYGSEEEEVIENFADVVEEMMSSTETASKPGGILVNVFPILKYIPEWFPGAGFQRSARYFRNLGKGFVVQPFETVRSMMNAGVAKPCLVEDALRTRFGQDEGEDYETDVMYVSATVSAGGIDTTRSSLEVLILAMMLHPGTQSKAQAELDKATGGDHLPNFEDLEHCPYIRAIVTETIRWQAIVPLAVPHCNTADDEYRRYYIPKGTIVFGNSWAILHDENKYPEPFKFRPERFLKPDGTFNDPEQSSALAAFGFGRRKCPGRFFAVDEITILAASILAYFHVSPPAGTAYTINEPAKLVMSPGSMSYPLPFECDFRPRSELRAQLLKEAFGDQN